MAKTLIPVGEMTMRSFSIEENDAGQRLDRFLSKTVPDIPTSLLQKGIRTKNIKVNGKRCRPDQRLNRGDVVSVFLPVEAGVPAERAVGAAGPLDVVYEDWAIIVLNKPSGLLSQPEPGKPGQDTLEGRMRAYLHNKSEWDPAQENSFAPSLCHRLDRNTEGLVIGAKSMEALRVLSQKIKDREIQKKYLCLVYGRPAPPEGRLEDQLFKDARKRLVLVKPSREKGTKTAILEYRTLKTSGALSLVECTLVTGRTHQIRVQMASRGWPLAGDGKYGNPDLDRRYGRKGQALCAYKIVFSFRTPAGGLEYLNGREIRLHKKFEGFDA